jgi:hypothetical protein
MAVIGGIIGFEASVFLIGLIYLLKGRIKLSEKKTVGGLQVRLGSLAMMLPIPLAFVLANFIGTPQNGLLANAVALLTGAVGIVLTIMGLLIGFLLIFTAESVSP